MKSKRQETLQLFLGISIIVQNAITILRNMVKYSQVAELVDATREYSTLLFTGLDNQLVAILQVRTLS